MGAIKETSEEVDQKQVDRSGRGGRTRVCSKRARMGRGWGIQIQTVENRPGLRVGLRIALLAHGRTIGFEMLGRHGSYLPGRVLLAASSRPLEFLVQIVY